MRLRDHAGGTRFVVGPSTRIADANESRGDYFCSHAAVTTCRLGPWVAAGLAAATGTSLSVGTTEKCQLC